MTAPEPPAQIPLTVIGGYLGAGKTTLVNRLLRRADGLRLAVLVNEFGDLPIDGDLIESRDGNVINIAGGCVCCSYGSDLMAALMDLDKRDPRPDHLLVEASGVALPAAIAQSASLIAGYALDAIVVLADAETVRAKGADPYLADTIAGQLASADIVVLNKVDLVPDSGRAAARDWLSARAPHARVLETVEAELPLAAVLGSGAERLATPESHHDHAHDHHPDHHLDHQAAVFTVDAPVDAEALAAALAGAELDLVRAKGFVPGRDGRLRALHVVGRRWRVADPPPGTRGPGRLVCIRFAAAVDTAAIERLIAAGG
ncbi:MAG: GTP-binding protein [Hyphomicrobiales bacterium]|nr:GTP-binding protein [Hyphomicrobiales bacterium]MCP5373284.1 GTP-binding protein [Hyphomicrobiales bacterium]